MSGDRYRMVTVQGGKAHVSSVVLAADEVREHLELEKSLHEATGWAVVNRRLRGEQYPELSCVRGMIFRRVYVRRFSPLDDMEVSNASA